MRDRARRSPSARLLGLLAALLLVLGVGGTSQGGAAPGGHPTVAAAGGAQGPQAVLGLHAQPRPAEHPGKAAGLPVALGVAVLLARWRRSPRVHTSAAGLGRPARGSRAPPRSSTSA